MTPAGIDTQPSHGASVMPTYGRKTGARPTCVRDADPAAGSGDAGLAPVQLQIVSFTHGIVPT